MTITLLILVVSLGLSMFAAAAETALTSVSRIRIRSLIEEGNNKAKLIEQLHKDPNAYLSTILSLNTVAVIVASSSAAIIAFEKYPRLPQVVSTIVLSLFVLVFCEISPKSLALRFNEKISLTLARPVAWSTTLLRPIIGTLTGTSSLLLRVATRGAGVPKPFVTEDELKLLVTVGEREGIVELEEREMIHGILEMTDKAVREVMVPRVDVIGIEVEENPATLIELLIKYGHSRIPVYEDTIDNVVGVVYAKDLLVHNVRSSDTTSLKSLAREAYFTPEAKHVGELLHEMQANNRHIAIVVDEYGGTAGIITIEDLIEEIVGPIRDEYDIAEQEEMNFINDREVLLNGRMPLDDVLELLHMQREDTEADSIGGIIYERLGEIPKPGATVKLGDATLTVELIRRQSIQTIRLTSPKPLLDPREPKEQAKDAEQG